METEREQIVEQAILKDKVPVPPETGPQRRKPVRKIVRINVNLPTEVYENLKTQADEAGQDMSEFVRNALRVHTTLREEASQGKKVYIGKNDNIEKELLLP